MSQVFNIIRPSKRYQSEDAIKNIYKFFLQNDFKIGKNFYQTEYIDLRSLFFKYMGVKIEHYFLKAYFISNHLFEEEWWVKEFKGIKESVPNKKLIIANKLIQNDQSLKDDIILTSIREFETFIISIYKEVFNQRLINRTIDLSPQINLIIDETHVDESYKKFFQILYNLKLCLNNGRYHINEDLNISYKGKEYLFTKDFILPSEYYTWEFIEFYLVELGIFVLDVINSQIISLKSEIVHPLAKINELHEKELASEETAENAIRNLSKIQLSDKTNEEDIIKEILKFGTLPTLVNKIPRGFPIHRARINKGKSFSKVLDLSYIPPHINKDYGRASIPNKTMFYGGISILSSKNIYTIDPSILLICEASELFRKRDQIKEGKQIITVGTWITKKEIPLYPIIQFEKFKDESEWLKESREFNNRFLRQIPSQIKILKRITGFIASEFAKKVKDQEHYNYMISAIYADHIMNVSNDYGLPIGGFLYPSVQTDGEGVNVAIHTDWVDEFLQLEHVLEMEVYKKDGIIHPNYLKRCFVDSNSSSFELKNISDPDLNRTEEQIQILLNNNKTENKDQ